MVYATFLATAAGLLIAERLPALRFLPLAVLRRGVATDALCLVTGALALGTLMRAVAARWVAGAGVLVPEAAALGMAVTIVIAVVLHDLGAYLAHWLLHRFDALWEIHKVHHSSLQLDWLATFRAHVLEHALRHLASPVALLLVGFPAGAVAIAAGVHAAWAMLVHANLDLRLRVLEPVLVTPRLHRLHHVSTAGAANLGTLFTIWDRLRGSLSSAPDAPLAPLGVPGEVTTYPQTWGRQLIEPFRRGRRGGGPLLHRSV